MSGNLTIRGARLVLPDRVVTGDLVVQDGTITTIAPRVEATVGEVIDAQGLTVLPGLIDTQVHFRGPGPSRQDDPSRHEDLESGSRAAAAGGVTAFLDLPDTSPPTTTRLELHDKLERAAQVSCVHYGFYLDATPSNLSELNAAERTCGVRLNTSSLDPELALDEVPFLEELFSEANQPIALSGEDPSRIRERSLLYEDSVDPADHSRLHDVESSLAIVRTGLRLAQKHGRRLHLLQVSSAEELALLEEVDRQHVTASACLPNLFLASDTAYETLGPRAVTLPPLRGERHTRALWRALRDGRLDGLASDHVPLPESSKTVAYPQTPPGLPGVEWTLPLLLDLVRQGALTLPELVRISSEGPARCFRIPRKGRLEVGYDGDLVLVDTAATHTVGARRLHTRCAWSPYAERELTGWPVATAVLGRVVYREGQVLEGVRGRELTFGGTTLGGPDTLY